MPKSPRLTAKEVIRLLKQNGFVEVSQTGSHLKLFNPITRRTVIVPIHSKKVIPTGTLKSIEKQANFKFNNTWLLNWRILNFWTVVISR